MRERGRKVLASVVRLQIRPILFSPPDCPWQAWADSATEDWKMKIGRIKINEKYEAFVVVLGLAVLTFSIAGILSLIF